MRSPTAGGRGRVLQWVCRSRDQSTQGDGSAKTCNPEQHQRSRVGTDQCQRPFAIVDYLLWINGGIGYIALAAVLVIKKRYRTFPWFSALLASDMLQTLLLTTVCATQHALRYFYTYWG